MRKYVISLLLILCAMGMKAQHPATSNGNDTGKAVFEGDIKNVPDGIVVNFWSSDNGDYIGEAVATIVNGKFRFERNINKKNKYLITLTDKAGEDVFANDNTKSWWEKNHELVIPIALGTTKITGSGSDCKTWRVENSNPKVVEENAYYNYKRTHIPAYMDEKSKKNLKGKVMIGNPAVKDTMSIWGVHPDEIYAEENFYVNSMYEFMKDMPYSDTYLKEFKDIARIASYEDNAHQDEILEKARKLCLKIPFKEVPIFLGLFANGVLNVDDDIEDFTLYDRSGKKHHLTEFNGKGKYMLLELCRKDDEDIMASRPKAVLDDLYKNYSNNLNIVTVDCVFKDVWTSGKLPRDQWNEWNDYNNGLPLIARYSNVYNYVFISPDGKILGFGKHEDLKDKAKQHFAFVK